MTVGHRGTMLRGMRFLLQTAGLAGCLLWAPSVLAVDAKFAPEAARACPRHGPGFVQVPGSATCIRIGGHVRAEYGGSTRRIDRDRIAGFGSSASVSADTRTDTEYGPLRSYVRIRAGQGPRSRD